MADEDSEQSWLSTFLGYALLSSDYPSVLRYISGFFTLLGLVFTVPFALLIALDLVLWIGRTCWNRAVPAMSEPVPQSPIGDVIPDVTSGPSSTNNLASSVSPGIQDEVTRRRSYASSNNYS